MEKINTSLKKIVPNAGTPTKNSTTSSNTDAAPPANQPCPICGGTGFLRQDLPLEHPDFGKVVPCQCRTQNIEEKQLARLRAISNLDALEHYTFDTFRPDGLGLNMTKRINLQSAYKDALDFAQNPHGWLVLLGNYGCGKTHLAAAIANACIDRGEPALFVVVPDLLDHLRAAFGPHSTTTYDQRFEQIRSAPLLLLDDLGTQSATPWAQEKLFQLFNHRYNARLATVITTNHKLEEIDQRVRSRLADTGLVVTIAIQAPDFRQAGGETLSELSSLPQHDDKTFETFDLRTNELPRETAENLRRAFTLARDYAKNPADWLLFTGSYGCGKTHLAAAIANEYTRRGNPALFIVVPDLLDHLRAAFSPSALTPYDKRFEEVRNAPLLVLDDLGTQSATPWAQEKLYQLFNHRYNSRLPTIITMADITDLDPRLKSRLMDIGRCTPFAITAGSYRSSMGQQNNKTFTRKQAAPKTGRKTTTRY